MDKFLWLSSLTLIDVLYFVKQAPVAFRIVSVAGIILSNALMWKTFSQALASSKSSIHVTALNSATNMLFTVT